MCSTVALQPYLPLIATQDLQKASYADGKWVYAEVVAGLSAVTCLVYAGLFFVPSEKFFAWDWILL